jgi:hypothetical protein
MPTIYQVQAPDGSILDIEGPDDATDEQIAAFAAQQFGAPAEKRGGGISVTLRPDITNPAQREQMGLPALVEQLDYVPGVTQVPGETDAAGIAGAVARGATAPMAGAALGAMIGAPIAGVGAVPGAVAGLAAGALTEAVGDPIVSGINRLFGTDFTEPTAALQNLLTNIGVPEADSEAERIVQKMTTGAAGGMGAVGVGRALQGVAGAARPVLSRVGAALAEQPAAQIVGGAGAGLAAGMVPEGAGALAETGAALVGGLAGGVAGAAGAARVARGATGGAGVGGRGNASAAATPEEVLRRERAERFDVPILPPQATRNPAELQRLSELAKNNEVGGDIRRAMDAQQERLGAAFERFVEGTGSEAWANLGEQGVRIVGGLKKMLDQSKARVRTLYKQAENSEDSKVIVPLNEKITTAIDGEDVETSLFDFINGRIEGVPSAAVVDAARKIAIKMGIATKGDDGMLVPRPATVKQMEEFRREIVGVADATVPVQLRDETIVKNLIDAHTDAHATGAWAKARAARREQAEKFEDVGLIAQILGTKRNSSDRVVAAEKVVSKIMSETTPAASIVRMRDLLTGEGGQPQAWRELQGAVMEQIKEAAYKGVVRNQAGDLVIKPTALDNVLRGLDKAGKLDALFDKRTAQDLRDINLLVQDLATLPPGVGNPSGTASTIINFLDMASNIPGVGGLAAKGVSKAREAAARSELRQEVKRLVGDRAQ